LDPLSLTIIGEPLPREPNQKGHEIVDALIRQFHGSRIETTAGGKERVKKALEFIGGMLLSFLPQRYRRDRALLSETIAAAVLQGFAVAVILGGRFVIFAWQRAGILGPPTDTPSNLPEVNAVRGSGIFMMAEFIFQPLNLLLLYLIYEAVVRFGSAFISHQVLGSLPFYCIGKVHDFIDRRRLGGYLGELIVDDIVRSSGGLLIRSCRPKLHWNPYMTVEYEGEFYQMIREEPGKAPRRFTYHLKKNHVGRIVVAIDHYDPASVLEPAPTTSALQQMWASWRPMLKLKAPLVEDVVVRGGGERQDYTLKIYSCRAKSEWTAYVAIEFEDELYELIREEKMPGPREFVYFLRKIRAGRSAAVVRRYRTDQVLAAE